MRRRRYRTIHVAQLDRLSAEAEAIRRAMAAGARDAWVRSSERILDQDGKPVWEVVLRVSAGTTTSATKRAIATTSRNLG